MEKRILGPGLLLAIIGLVLVGAAFASAMTGAAQSGSDGLWCRDARYDYDRDGRFSKADLDEFFEITRANRCLYAEVGSSDCGQYDLDGNQYVDDLDVAVAHDVFMGCYRSADDTKK